MASKQEITKIRDNLRDNIGNSITVKANVGRKKIIEETGVLEQIYPNVFVVKLQESGTDRRISYSYIDVLTRTVELSILPKQ